jgi:hypothetical protein
VRGNYPYRYSVPTPSHARSEAVSFARRVEPGRATRSQKTETSRTATGLSMLSRSGGGFVLSCSCLQQRDKRMTNKPKNSPAPLAGRSRNPPVRVKV